MHIYACMCLHAVCGGACVSVCVRAHSWMHSYYSPRTRRGPRFARGPASLRHERGPKHIDVALYGKFFLPLFQPYTYIIYSRRHIPCVYTYNISSLCIFICIYNTLRVFSFSFYLFSRYRMPHVPLRRKSVMFGHTTREISRPTYTIAPRCV